MRFVIQRVMHSKVTINGEVRGQIGKGFMVLIGVGEEDTVEIAEFPDQIASLNSAGID